MTATVLNTNISEVENKMPDNSKNNTTQEVNKLAIRKSCSKINASSFSE